MSPLARALLVLATVAAGPEPGAAPEPEPRSEARVALAGLVVEARVESGVRLGDLVSLEVRVDAPERAAVSDPVLDAGPEPRLELRDPFRLEHEHRAGGRSSLLYRARLQAFETGLVPVGALSVIVRAGGAERVLAVPALGVRVASVLPPGPLPPLKGAKGLLALAGRGLGPGLLLLGAALAAALLWLLRRRRGPGRAPAPGPETGPEEWALRELQALSDGALMRAGRVKDLYVKLAGIVREYLSRRFRMAATEMTTGELVEAVAGRPGLAAKVREDLRSLLELADLVKFARHEPGPATCQGSLDSARSLVIRCRGPGASPCSGAVEDGRER